METLSYHHRGLVGVISSNDDIYEGPWVDDEKETPEMDAESWVADKQENYIYDINSLYLKFNLFHLKLLINFNIPWFKLITFINYIHVINFTFQTLLIQVI